MSSKHDKKTFLQNKNKKDQKDNSARENQLTIYIKYSSKIFIFINIHLILPALYFPNMIMCSKLKILPYFKKFLSFFKNT